MKQTLPDKKRILVLWSTLKSFDAFYCFTHDLSLDIQKILLIFANFFPLIVLLEFLTRSYKAAEKKIKTPSISARRDKRVQS